MEGKSMSEKELQPEGKRQGGCRICLAGYKQAYRNQ